MTGIPMNVLAIECSCHQGSVAALKNGVLTQTWEFESPRGRGTEYFTHLEAALSQNPETDLVIVGTGPGSYNGLRMAISSAWGVARARGAKLAGVSSLLGYDAPEYFIAGDARANQWFIAHVANGLFLSPPRLASPQDVQNSLLPGIPVYSTSGLKGLPEAIVAPPRAALLATRSYAEGVPEPLYLKAPHITKPAGA